MTRLSTIFLRCIDDFRVTRQSRQAIVKMLLLPAGNRFSHFPTFRDAISGRQWICELRIKIIGAQRSSARNDLPWRFAHTHAKGHALLCRCVFTGSRGLMRQVIIKTPFRAHGGERWDVRLAIIKPLPRLSRNGLVNGPLWGRSYYTYCRRVASGERIRRGRYDDERVDSAAERFRGRPRPLKRPRGLHFFLRC